MISSPRLERRWSCHLVGVAAGLIGVAGVALVATPRLGARLIRAVFQHSDRRIIASLKRHAPDDVTTFADETYRPDDPDARLDVHVPDTAIDSGEALPTVVWTHGGAWVAGSKDAWAPYFKVLASHGYTVVAPRYSLGPAQTYPTALRQLNDALTYLEQNAVRLHVDPERIVLAGDSAGAQISSQFATIVSRPAFAAQVGVAPTIAPDRLKGVLLYCGIYDFGRYFDGSGVLGWGARVAIWAYTGSRSTTFGGNPALAEMSSLNHVTPEFPATFISGGNADPLTQHQSRALATRLERLGVDVTTLFFPEDHEPPLPHEYQFDLDSDAGQEALAESVEFLEGVLKR